MVFLSRRCQNVENVHETLIDTKILFYLTIDYRMHLKFLQKPRCLGSKQALRNAVKKTRLNSSKDNFITKNFCLSMKRKLTILLSFPFVSFIGVFSMLKCKTLVLMNARQPFCWWMSFTKVLNPFLPHPLRVDHLTFVAGYGWFSLGRNFFPIPLELEIF